MSYYLRRTFIIIVIVEIFIIFVSMNGFKDAAVEKEQSVDYYTEKYRPQFHFSPKMNWMNDPNGLVFYKGKYHHIQYRAT